MLDESLLTDFAYQISNQYEALNTKYLKMMGKHLKEIGELSASDIHRVQQMVKMGVNVETITNELSAVSGLTTKQVQQGFEQLAKGIYKDSKPLYMLGIGKQPAFKNNLFLRNFIQSVSNATGNTLKNISHTTAIGEPYRKAVDNAILQVASGTEDYKTAMRSYLRQCANGMRVQYASGITRRIDSAVRMNVLAGARRINQGTREIMGEQFGADGWEISAHNLCAVDHLPIQGRQYSKKDFESLNAGLDRPIGELNCMHTIFPIILGISEPAYTNEELAQLQRNSNEQITIDGKTLSRYEWTQECRKMETEMRYCKDRMIISDTDAADDKVEYDLANNKLNYLRRKYRKVCESAGIQKHYERAYVAGFKGKQVTPKPVSLNSNKTKVLSLSSEEKREILSYKSFDYYEINEILRTAGYSGLTTRQKSKVKTLDKALSKLPKYKGNLSRSLEFRTMDDVHNFITELENNKKITFKQYISTTYSDELYNTNGQVQIYISNSKKGRLLKEFDNGEFEVLYERNSTFKVINIVEQDGIYYILLEEL